VLLLLFVRDGVRSFAVPTLSVSLSLSLSSPSRARCLFLRAVHFEKKSLNLKKLMLKALSGMC
jgi:hypothetical protein